MNTNQHPTFYKIRQRGKLDLGQAAWFPELVHAEDDDGNTLLVGELPDQAALIGVLFRAQNLNLMILCMKLKFPNEYFEDKDEKAI